MKLSSTFTITITLLISLLFQQVQSVPVHLTIQNWKQNFGCELDDYRHCQNSFKRDWFIMFIAPWCGHCKRAKPQFQDFYAMTMNNIIQQNRHLNEQQMQKIFQSSLQIGIVDCKDQADLCQYFNVNRFPTFAYITTDKKVIHSTNPVRTKQSFLNFTLHHDPQIHSHCKYGVLAHTFWDDIFQVIQENWVKFLILGVVFPSLIGYCLGQLVVGKMNKSIQKKVVTQNKNKQNQLELKATSQQKQQKTIKQQESPQKKESKKQQ